MTVVDKFKPEQENFYFVEASESEIYEYKSNYLYRAVCLRLLDRFSCHPVVCAL